MAQYGHFVSDAEHHLRYVHPMSPHPYHDADAQHAWEEHARQHEQQRDEDVGRSAKVHIAVAAVYMRKRDTFNVQSLKCECRTKVCSFLFPVASAYTWLVVLLAHRKWSSGEKRHHSVGPGDEGYAMSNLASKEPLRADEV